MTIVERIKERCKELNTSMNALEKELGFGNGSIRLWDNKDPGAKKAQAVAERLEKSLDWLITGKEPGELTQEEQELINLYRQSDERGQRRIRQTAKLEAADQTTPEGVSTSRTGKTGTDN